MARIASLLLTLLALLALPAPALAAPIEPAIVVPSLDELPDLLGPVVFAVPQCGACNPDGTILLPPQPWGETWDGWDVVNPVRGFQKIISWLAWQIRETIRQLICWLFALLQLLANILALAVNLVISGINGLWRLGLFILLNLYNLFLGAWDLFEALRELLVGIWQGVASLGVLVEIALQALLFVAAFIGSLIGLLGTIVLGALGILSWIGAVAFGLLGGLLAALGGTSVPVQLQETRIQYLLMRGALEGLRDSAFGWLFVLAWSLAYVGFIVWLAKFLPNGGETA